MNNNFEKDTVILAIAFALFILIFSGNLGRLLYGSNILIDTPGYKIQKITDDIRTNRGIPDVLDISQIMVEADPVLGKLLFNKCMMCHTIDKGALSKIGPNLWNIVGSTVGNKKSFIYSNAMQMLNNEGMIWDFEKLYRFLYSPRKYIRGTKMAFIGIKDDHKRASVIAYLNQQPVNKSIP